ncbi:Cell adhesion molecule-related/down-regulated by oncogenes [Bienertia sinuspersici]
MGLLVRSLVVLLMILLSACLPIIRAQSRSSSARVLDSVLQDYAYRAFVRPRTGVPFDGTVPANLTGIKVSGMRLRSGSLRSRGVKSYKEFEIPVGVVVQPYVERLVLVYQNLGNWSSTFYPLSGYMYLAPVLGLLAYDAVNLSATNLSELDIRASINPIKIHFSNVQSVPDGSVARCLWFDLRGNVNFSNVVSKNTCATVQQGHFALVVERTAPSPAPSLAPAPSQVSHKKKRNTKKIWIIVGSVLGGILLLVLLGMLLVCLKKYRRKKKMQHMEKASDVGEALRMTSVGSGKAPAAMVTRTQPSLETEYAP